MVRVKSHWQPLIRKRMSKWVDLQMFYINYWPAKNIWWISLLPCTFYNRNMWLISIFTMQFLINSKTNVIFLRINFFQTHFSVNICKWLFILDRSTIVRVHLIELPYANKESSLCSHNLNIFRTLFINFHVNFPYFFLHKFSHFYIIALKF